MDFLLDDKEDIIFNRTQENNQLVINFTRNNALRIIFSTKCRKINDTSGDLAISFAIKKAESVFAQTTIGQEEIKHLIKIALKTELGELKVLPAYGSKIVLHKHKDYSTKEDLEKIAEVIKNAIHHIIPQCDIVCKRELSTGNFYCQNLTVYIYDENGLLFLKEPLSEIAGGVL